MSKAAVSIAIAMAVALEVEACMMRERPIPGSFGIFGLYTVVSPQVALPFNHFPITAPSNTPHSPRTTSLTLQANLTRPHTNLDVSTAITVRNVPV